MNAPTTIALAIALFFAGLAGYFFLENQNQRQHITDSKDTIGQLQEQNRILSSQNEKLQADLNTRSDKISRSDDAVRKLKEQVDAMNKEKARLEEERHQAIAERDLVKASTQHQVVSFKKLDEMLKRNLKSKDIYFSQDAGKMRITIPSQTLFASGSTDILPDAKKLLSVVAAAIKASGKNYVRVEGHTDNIPIGGLLLKQFPTNWELSSFRAVAITRFFHENEGLQAKMLTAVGCGDAQPIAPNDMEENRAKNRRIEIEVTPVLERVQPPPLPSDVKGS